MAMQTSAESPVPVRTVLNAVAGWIGRLGRIWVEGQITELNRRAGTVYLTLRDPVANMSVRVVGPRAVFEAAGPAVTGGARVVICAKPDFWVNRGAFSLSALEVRPVGVGELLARLERLKQVLAAEGLFRPERKRPLPFLPAVVGLICGRESDAEHDVLRNARRRWPAVRFRIEHAAVQGAQAVPEVLEALRRLDADPQVEVIVIARGGGSMEDLLPFSDEALVRAVAAARTPVVSAIGHEQDSPLLDLVADVRASTPTDAAKHIVPDVREQLRLIRQLRDRGRRCLAGRLERELAWLEAMRSRPALADPVREVERKAEQVEGLRERARRALAASLEREADHLAHTRARLRALSPAATLERGYAIVQRPDGTVLRAAAQAEPGEELLVRLAGGRLRATAVGPAD
ncbi:MULTISPECIES: exodeoxyribonuclease VII large subunit [Thermomonospora]|uniref:Exodeoxyribonuclease 7 large subunit n=1 Tax=Thermomonospora curvata (strain ATCC 19995 / DSM 43183 / JCM 3096 / KCTC 9072 / NBRC 15933 / NCIMB 10081 / Henssen B9) TaxID=471852 RepID=D1A8H9_THECD|nr:MULTISPECIES: exodeoxyribonuclease VII large subunit [Thermomonospora]ACY96674.1 exodeoxyribonuclease VII, large subunit [Thermomonospora curvata DSM 43183]PKK15470.1 MAG: exodeoxyribonuclease VII large subunit [Thermomonospora sp. CIF 1]